MISLSLSIVLLLIFALDYRTIEFTRDTINAPLITKTYPPSKKITYCMWMNPKEVHNSATDLDAVFSLSKTSQKHEVSFVLKDDSLRFFFQGVNYDITYDVSTLLNKWTHVCAVYRGLVIKVFLNGQLLEEKDYNAGFQRWEYLDPFEVSIALGQYPESSGVILKAHQAFPGKISEFFYFTVTFSEENILKVYNGEDIDSIVSMDFVLFQMSDFGNLVDNDAVVQAPYPF